MTFCPLAPLPTDVQELILLHTVKMELRKSNVAKQSWEMQSAVIMSRLAHVCPEWHTILKTNYFKNTLRRSFHEMEADPVRLKALTKTVVRCKVLGIAAVNGEIFMLCEPTPGKQRIINVYDSNNIAAKKFSIKLKDAGAIDIAGCTHFLSLYVLSSVGGDISVSLVLKKTEHEFIISLVIRESGLRHPALSISANGSIILSSRKKRDYGKIRLYTATGCLQREIEAPDKLKLLRVIPKSSGNLVCVSRSRQIGTRLTEIDPCTGTPLRQYESSLIGSGYSLLDADGSIVLTTRSKRLEIIDPYFNLKASNNPELDEISTGFVGLDEDFKALNSIPNQFLSEQTRCRNLMSFNPAKSELIWMNFDRKYKANVFTQFSYEY